MLLNLTYISADAKFLVDRELYIRNRLIINKFQITSCTAAVIKQFIQNGYFDSTNLMTSEQ